MMTNTTESPKLGNPTTPMNATKGITKTKTEEDHRLRLLIPKGAWDSHMHIFDGQEEDRRAVDDHNSSSTTADESTSRRTKEVNSSSGTTRSGSDLNPPGSSSRPPEQHPQQPKPKKPAYHPPPSTIQSAIDLLGPVTPKMVIVQPSVLGEDNRITLGGVRDLRRWGRGGLAGGGEVGGGSADTEGGRARDVGVSVNRIGLGSAGDGAAVVEVALGVSDEVLRDLDGRGARGVR